jgi:hypothetical protein
MQKLVIVATLGPELSRGLLERNSSLLELDQKPCDTIPLVGLLLRRHALFLTGNGWRA